MAIDPRLMMVDYSQLGKIGQTVATGMQDRRMKMVEGLAGKALMGDPAAMQELGQYDPAVASQVQQKLKEQSYQTEQRDMTRKSALAKEMQDFYTRFGAIEDPDQFIMQGTQALQSDAFPYMKQEMEKTGEFLDYGDYDSAKLFYQQAQAQGGKSFADKAVAAQRTNPETGLVEQGFMVYDPTTKKGRFETIEGGVLKETPEEKRRRELESKIKLEQEKQNIALATEPEIARLVEAYKAEGKESGAEKAKLQALEASLPNLYNVVDNLKELGQVATYTKSGKVYDAAVRELGFTPPEGATARAKYIATVDNEILPLLKQTFGAAFTQKEGETLKATLGDPDMSPEEKNAQLDAFIEAKIRQADSIRTQLGMEPIARENPTAVKPTSKYQIEVIE